MLRVTYNTLFTLTAHSLRPGAICAYTKLVIRAFTLTGFRREIQLVAPDIYHTTNTTCIPRYRSAHTANGISQGRSGVGLGSGLGSALWWDWVQGYKS